jgi:pimeloyl-ACP methyl ester carboxylesterase
MTRVQGASTRVAFEAGVTGGALAGWVQGDGPEVLLLHGGPGLSFEYLDGLAGEIGPGWRIAAYQQRGLAPSTTAGPFSVRQELDDVRTVLDALGWDRAWVVGHSWGGHLLLHLALAAPERVRGGLAVDPLGGVGDGGAAAFEAAMLDRTSEADRRRAEALDQRAMAGEGTAEELIESVRLFWPAYFASPDDVAPFPALRSCPPAYAAIWESIVRELPRLEVTLRRIDVPLGFLAGADSPLPAREAAVATARAVPGAWAEVLDGAGHFPWHESPGCVRAALERLSSA